MGIPNKLIDIRIYIYKHKLDVIHSLLFFIPNNFMDELVTD